MAATGIDDGYSRRMSIRRQADCGHGVINVLLYLALACAAVIVPAGRIDAADSTLAASDPAQPQSYRQKVANEAEELRASGAAAAATAVAPPADRSESYAGANKDRRDQVKAAVIEALGKSASDTIPAAVGETLEGSESGTDPVDARRRQLRELVVNAPAPDSLREDGYVDELRDEVAQTVVVDDVTAKAAEASSPDGAMDRGGPGSYQVKPGDSLWKIAVMKFGDGHKWKSIYAANSDSLADVNVLPVGQMLKIPGQVSSSAR